MFEAVWSQILTRSVRGEHFSEILQDGILYDTQRYSIDRQYHYSLTVTEKANSDRKLNPVTG